VVYELNAKERKPMPTQEDRITALEQATSEYRPVLQNFAYELSMVKGLIITQTDITQELKRGMNEVKQQLSHIEKHLDQADTRLDRLEILLTQILKRLPEK
jgi:predicted  nucleic acid-binding Zn-ribbon protein